MPTISRRKFLQLSGSASAVLAASAWLPDKFLLWAEANGLAKASYVPTFCEMCFWKCGVIAKVINGRVVKLDGNPYHPASHGKLCARGQGGLGLLYDPDRLQTPLIRTGERGDGSYRKATWDEALALVADKMRQIKERYGPESVALFCHGTPTDHFFHLLQAFGSPNVAQPSFAQCRGPRVAAYEITYGEDVGSPERLDLANSRVIVLLGSHLGENMHNSQVQDFCDGLGNGARLIVVDPRFSTAAGKADHWLPIRPATDMALLLAWINVIIREGWYDREYVAAYTTGFAELARGVERYTPEWAAKETGIEAARIVETAREMGRYRPAVCVHPGRHVTWDGNDVQRERAIAILGAILGTWGRKGGVYLATKSSFPAMSQADYPVPARPALARGNYPFAGAEGVTNALRASTLSGQPYPVKGWLVAGTNLLGATPNRQETVEAIRKLDLLVAVDVLPMETAMFADVVLPECTYLERHDALAVGRGLSLGAALRQPAIPPRFESKPGWWIAKELGKRLGLEEFFTWESYEDRLNEQCLTFDLDFDQLKAKGALTVPGSANPYLAPDNPPVFKTPSGKIELYSKELKEKGFDPLPRYQANSQPPAGSFRLIYGRSPLHTFTRTANNPVLAELCPENEAWIGPGAARTLGLTGGEYVVLVNQDGVKSNRVKVKVTERIHEECLYLVHGFGSASKRLSRAYRRGADDQGLITRYTVDPIAGTTGMRGNFVRIVKEV